MRPLVTERRDGPLRSEGRGLIYVVCHFVKRTEKRFDFRSHTLKHGMIGYRRSRDRLSRHDPISQATKRTPYTFTHQEISQAIVD
jgi:hypothetical protein